MKPQVLLTLGLFIVIIAVIFVSKCQRKTDYSPAIASINKKYDSLAKVNISIQLERNAYKMEAQAHRKQADETGKELAVVKKERDYLKRLKPVTQKDSLIKYVLLDANCDSLTAKLESESGQYQQEADMWHRSSDKADTVIMNLQKQLQAEKERGDLKTDLVKQSIKSKPFNVSIGAGVGLDGTVRPQLSINYTLFRFGFNKKKKTENKLDLSKIINSPLANSENCKGLIYVSQAHLSPR
jgi:hypothetical protein